MAVGLLYIPAVVELAEVVATRVDAHQSNGSALVEEARQIQKYNNLYHALGHVLKLRPSSPSASTLFAELGEHLWQTIDNFVANEQITKSALPAALEGLPDSSSKALRSDAEVWNEFWEHYRHCRSRSEEPEVLRGGAMSARGAKKWAFGNEAFSARIRSSSENFRWHERTCEPLPPSAAISRAETPRTPLDRTSITSRDKDPALVRRTTPSTPQKPWTPSTKVDEQGHRHSSRGSRPCSKANNRPGSKDTSKKANVEARKDQGKQPKAKYSEWGFVTDTYVDGASSLNLSSCNFNKGSAQLPPLKGFKDYKNKTLNGFQDYRNKTLNGFQDCRDKKRRSAHTADATMVQEIEQASPRILTAAREIQSVQEYRSIRTQDSCKTPGRSCIGFGTPRVRKDVSHRGFTTHDGVFPNSFVSSCTEQMHTTSTERHHTAPAFHRPWSRDHAARHDLRLQPVEADAGKIPCTRLTAVERFAELCRSAGVHPRPASVIFLVKLLPGLDLRDAGYSDQDILALAAALPYRDAGKIQSIDLSDNGRLTDTSVCEFLQALADMHAKTLKTISLKGCSRLSCRTSSLLICKLQERFVELEMIDMSGITISSADYQNLARNIRDHRRLRDIRLANTGLSFVGTASAKNIVTSLLTNGQLQALDLGWNSLETVVFKALGEGIVAQNRLSSLSLANTGSCCDPSLNGSPILVFLEYLAGDKRLTALDLSSNALDQGAPFILEYALRCHPLLQSINISSNPIGLHGKRCLLRLLAGPHNPKFSRVDMTNCDSIVADRAHQNSFGCDPSGHYTIPLWQPSHRASLLVLLTRWASQQSNLPLSRLFRNAVIQVDGVYTQFDFQNMSNGEDHLWNTGWGIPSYGELSFTLDVSGLLWNQDSSLPSEAVEFCKMRSRLEINVVSKVHAVLGAVKGAKSESEWCQLLEALSLDFILTAEQVKALCITRLSKPSCGKIPALTFCQLLPCLLNMDKVQALATACTKSLMEIMHVRRTCQTLLSLNPSNPTKHYSLNLSLPCDRCVAEQLVLLNRWELQLWRARDCVDVSQHGNSKNFRNVMYNEQAFQWEIGEWRLPAKERLLFDYVSLQRPPSHAQPISSTVWSDVIAHVSGVLFGGDQDAGLASYYAKDALCAISSTCWISCAQLRELLCLFHEPGLRRHILMSFFLRTVDWPANSKVCRSKFNKKDWGDLLHHLGHLHMFSYLQPEDLSVSLDLSIYEQRCVLSLLVSLTAVEHPGNLRNPRMRTADSLSWDTFPLGVPKLWKSIENCPTHGTFEASYVCSQENKQLRTRRRLAVEMGGSMTLPEDLDELNRTVQWWSVLDDKPPELVSWLDFLVSNFTSLQQAFDKCDASKDGRMNLREFLTGMQQLGFRLPKEVMDMKKKNKKRLTKGATANLPAPSSRNDEEIRVLTVVYRFLDPNSNGYVTMKEFTALAGLWKELLHSTWDFVCHLRSTFGSVEQVWHIADKDGSGVLTNDEFLEFSNRIKYQGPVQQIYMYLDRDDNGTVGIEEWMALDCITRPDW